MKRYASRFFAYDSLLIPYEDGRWVIYDDVKIEIEQLRSDA